MRSEAQPPAAVSANAATSAGPTALSIRQRNARSSRSAPQSTLTWIAAVLHIIIAPSGPARSNLSCIAA